MREEITTTDLAKFGWREKRMAAELLTAMCDQGLPDDFYDDEVTIMFNTHSGNVFVTNSEFQVAMMNGDDLEMWYTCPECGEEGFLEDIEWSPQHGCCKECVPDDGESEEEI